LPDTIKAGAAVRSGHSLGCDPLPHLAVYAKHIERHELRLPPADAKIYWAPRVTLTPVRLILNTPQSAHSAHRTIDPTDRWPYIRFCQGDDALAGKGTGR